MGNLNIPAILNSGTNNGVTTLNDELIVLFVHPTHFVETFMLIMLYQGIL